MPLTHPKSSYMGLAAVLVSLEEGPLDVEVLCDGSSLVGSKLCPEEDSPHPPRAH